MGRVGPASGIFYGWFVVLAAFLVTFVAFGSAYTFSSFLESLQHEFGASRGAVSLVFSLAGFLYFGFGIVSGPLADRWGAKRLAGAGVALVGLGLLLASRAQSIVQVYAAYGIGIGAGVGCAYVPAVSAVQRWFVERRGYASGLAVSGIGVGTLVMPPLATGLIAGLGWRGAYLGLAALAVVLGAVAVAMIEDDPARRGLQPDGRPRAAAAASGSSQGLSVREAIRTGSFLALYVACMASSVGVFVPFVHLVPYALDHGIAAGLAVWLMSAIGVGSTLGRFFLGGIGDRLGRERFLVAMYLGMALTLAIWMGGETFAALIVFALTFGLFYGGWVAILPAVVADLFGARNVGGIIGVLYTSVGIGTLVGPSGAGYAYDLGRSYVVPIAAAAIANLVAALVMVACTPRARFDRRTR